MSRRLSMIILAAALLASCSASKTPEPIAGKAWFSHFTYTGSDPFFSENPLPEGKFYNPILSGFFPDPSICRKGDNYYMVNSTFSFFPGIPIFHSTDLVNWRQIGNVLDRPDQFINSDQPVSYGIFAPAIEYNSANDLFYLVTTYVGGGGNFLVTAADPAGPWSDPIWLPEVPGIDPSLFFDDDGRAYILNNQDPDYPSLYDGHKATWLQEFDVETNTTIGPRKMIRDGGHNLAEQPIWIEGPHLHKLHGYYYLIPAEGGTGINHSQVVFRSRNIWGPYQTWEGNPILTQRDLDKNRPNPVTNTGHADLIQNPNGDWYAVFLACRPYTSDNHFNIGRETFLLPVYWTEDHWPVILDRGLEVPMIVDLPNGAVNRDHESGFMKRGNFSFTEDFSGKHIPMEWIFLRTPVEDWYFFEMDHNGIWIDARAANLRERKQPSFLGTRQRHHDMTAETSLTFLPASDNELAGLTLFQNEAFHYTLGVTIFEGKNHVVLQKAERKEGLVEKAILSTKELPATFKGNIDLKVQCEKGRFSFWYKTGSSEWQLVMDNVDATYLSTERAGGFIGTILAMYASSNE
jgi:xylan 1,4-beta-xylosidase